VLDSDTFRPLLHLTKAELVDYALHHQLEWREDSTNSSDAYLRNRLRKKTQRLEDDIKRQLHALRAQQIESKHAIDAEVMALVGEGPSYSRYFFSHVPAAVAVECLRHITKGQLTRPQLHKVLLAIKTAKPKSSLTAGSGVTIDFTTRNFSLSLLK
jgi:tRNA(Ile)-lysidine synthase TilS/MesJ